MRSNLSVGPPIEVQVYRTNSFQLQPYYRLDEGNDYLRDVKRNWDMRLKEAFNMMPALESAVQPSQAPQDNSY
jgi:putative proteasome-type protease